MASRNHKDHPILLVTVVEQHANSQHGLIGMWIKCPVLVPLDGRPFAWGLNVKLAIVKTDTWSNEVLKYAYDDRIPS